MPKKSDLLEIPGVGKTFLQDFARIDVHCQADLLGQDPNDLYERLCSANAQEEHKTSKNYLYVIRMAVYYAAGGREASKLKWNAWKD